LTFLKVKVINTKNILLNKLTFSKKFEMGNLLTSGHGGVEEVASQASGAYKYPPTSGGSFFANHFIMGGEKFDSPQPEAFLFGENADLNFLGGKPVPFPYPPPQANEPTKTLRYVQLTTN
jgi:hypothetical protein